MTPQRPPPLRVTPTAQLLIEARARPPELPLREASSRVPQRGAPSGPAGCALR